MPACLTCRTAGSCPKGELPAAPVSTAKRQYARRAAMIEREQRGYITLTCDHVITFESSQREERYKVHGRWKFYCDRCGKMKFKKPKPAPEPLPTEPLF
jgi:hypothetical protein